MIPSVVHFFLLHSLSKKDIRFYEQTPMNIFTHKKHVKKEKPLKIPPKGNDIVKISCLSSFKTSIRLVVKNTCILIWEEDGPIPMKKRL